MNLPFSGIIEASFKNLNRALFSVGTIFILLGFLSAVALVLGLKSIPAADSWPLILTYLFIILGTFMTIIGGLRWHSHESKEQELKDFIMDSLQKEQTGTVEIDGETVSIEAEIGMREDDD